MLFGQALHNKSEHLVLSFGTLGVVCGKSRILALGFRGLNFILDLAVLVGEVLLIKRGRYVLTEKLLNLQWLHRL